MNMTSSPKSAVKYMAEMLYPDRTIDIEASRGKGGGKRYPYRVTVFADKKAVGCAEHRSWRTAYKILEIQLAKQAIL
jgi:hypothetical protein